MDFDKHYIHCGFTTGCDLLPADPPKLTKQSPATENPYGDIGSPLSAFALVSCDGLGTKSWVKDTTGLLDELWRIQRTIPAATDENPERTFPKTEITVQGAFIHYQVRDLHGMPFFGSDKYNRASWYGVNYENITISFIDHNGHVATYGQAEFAEYLEMLYEHLDMKIGWSRKYRS